MDINSGWLVFCAKFLNPIGKTKKKKKPKKLWLGKLRIQGLAGRTLQVKLQNRSLAHRNRRSVLKLCHSNVNSKKSGKGTFHFYLVTFWKKKKKIVSPTSSNLDKAAFLEWTVSLRTLGSLGHKSTLLKVTDGIAIWQHHGIIELSDVL